MESAKPFSETLASLMRMGDIGQRELARRCQRRGWGSVGTISKLLSGDIRPTLRSMEAIATAVETQPETFAEYRLLVARRELDPEVVGLKAALKRLAQIQRAD